MYSISFTEAGELRITGIKKKTKKNNPFTLIRFSSQWSISLTGKTLQTFVIAAIVKCVCNNHETQKTKRKKKIAKKN